MSPQLGNDETEGTYDILSKATAKQPGTAQPLQLLGSFGPPDAGARVIVEARMPRTAAFEKHADAYDDWFDTHRELYEAELAAVRQLIPKPGAKGLEVGVGSGRFAAPLGIGVGLEPSSEMARRARLRGIRVYPGVAERLPFPGHSFDWVLMVTTVCFVDDILQAFREARRVLRPEGLMIVGFVDKDSALGRQYAARREQSTFYKEATFYSPSEVLCYLTEAGFKPLRIVQTLVPGAEPNCALEGFGKGAFVVIQSQPDRSLTRSHQPCEP